MKTLFKKHTLLLCSGLVIASLLGCSEDEIPCIDQQLNPLAIVLFDQDDNNFLDEEASFVQTGGELYYLNEDNEEVDVAYTIKSTSEGEPYLESLEASQESLDGANTFFIRVADLWEIEFEYMVSNSTTSGCDVFSYEAMDAEGEELSMIEEGTPKPYIITLEIPEE